mmetsp:Transcript_26590/g.45392  ORF Transcript_26590/g.45392 Transcript_26590/m.45392 type:complete len:314 (+) Transcript_26590:129-1070(+)
MGSPKSSPKLENDSPSSGLKGKKGRPSTPHPNPTGKTFNFPSGSGSTEDSTPENSGKENIFNFDGVIESDHRAEVPNESCIGISLATVMSTFLGPSACKSPAPTTPLSTRFSRFRNTFQKTLSCADSKSSRSNRPNTPNSVNSACIDDRMVSNDRHVSFEGFERERSLMQRATSWSTQESGHDSPSSEQKGNVQFHYPPITSVRLRPRTASSDIKQLFFAPEELDEIEDDRSATRAADDIETLAVGAENWNTVPTCSSILTASYDDQSGLLVAGEGENNVMFDRVGSPRTNNSSNDRRFVRGVQIMLREKSTG